MDRKGVVLRSISKKMGEELGDTTAKHTIH